MSTTIKIELTPEAQKIVAGLQTLPVRMVKYVAAAMDAVNLRTVSHIQAKYLSFPQQGPTTLEGLRTFGGYRNRLVSSPANIAGDKYLSEPTGQAADAHD